MRTIARSGRPNSVITMSRCCVLLIIAWCCLPGIASGESVLRVRDQQQRYSLNAYIGVLEDRDAHLTIDDVRQPEQAGRFLPHANDSSNVGYTRSAYWARIRIVNESASPIWLLDVDYPLLDRIDLYVIDASGRITAKTTGDTFPFRTREIANRKFLFRLALPPGEHMTVYLRIETESAMTFPLLLWHPDAFAQKDHNEQFALGGYYGIMVAMICYNLFLLCAIRDRVYLYYLLYIITYSIAQMSLNGLSAEYLWPDSSWWGNRNLAFFVGATVLFITLFGRAFLKTTVYTPRLDRILKVVLVWSALAIALAFVSGYRLSIQVGLSSGAVAAIMLIIAGVLCLRQGDRAARFYLLGWTLFLCGFLAMYLRSFGLLPHIFLTTYGIQIGSVLEVILLSLGLADRMSLMKRQIEQTQREQQVEHELRQRNEELSLLHRVGQLFTSSLELSEVLEYILEEMRRLLGITAASFWLCAPESDEIVCQQAMGPGRDAVLGWRLKSGQGVVGQAAQSGDTVYVRDARHDARHYKQVERLTGLEYRSILAIPFRVKDVAIGVLNLLDHQENRFSENDLRLLELIASAAAEAVENARLYSQAQLELAERIRAEAQLVEANQKLQELLDNLQRAQSQLIQSERMAALGQLIAGVAHEINTPLGAIRSSIGNIVTALHTSLTQLPHVLLQLSPDRQQMFLALIERARQEKQYVTSREERQLRKKVAHALEIHQIPQADSMADMLVDMGIYDNLEPCLPLFQQGDTQIRDLLLRTAYHLATQYHNSQNIVLAVERASKVLFALKTYACVDQSGKMKTIQITEGIDLVLTLYHNQLKHGIELLKRYEAVPAIPCYPDELHQVWTNLIHNAIDAMNRKGALEIRVYSPNEASGKPQGVIVEMTDSGCGIPEDIRERIFEPLFTTKSDGEGSGLGLDIVKKIIDKHHGRIDVDSQPGKTTFSVWLPYTQHE